MANAAAKGVAERQDALRIGTDGIHALNARDDAALKRLISAAAIARLGSHARSAGAMRLARQGGARDYLLQVSSVEDSRQTSEAARTVIAVLICDPDSPSTVNPALLLDLFQLTAAEVRVVEQLLAGNSAKQVAETLGLAVATVRYHLGHLYRKTQTHRLSELVTLLQRLGGVALRP
jgi:DNA-binding CsgD family transcriptional regulator